MGWRNRRNVTRTSDERSSIGDGYVDEAVAKLNLTCGAAVATMTRYTQSREETLPMLFRDDDLAKLEAVLGMVDPSMNQEGYIVQPDVILTVSYAGAKVPTIERGRLYLQPDRIAPLLSYIAEVKAIHDKFEEVKAVLRWFNRNATPGAIRYYWPTALELCRKAPAFDALQEVPTRYHNPPKISSWLQPIKDAAATVAGSLLLPGDARPRIRDKMWLTFATTTVHLANEVFYATDQMVYYL